MRLGTGNPGGPGPRVPGAHADSATPSSTYSRKCVHRAFAEHLPCARNQAGCGEHSRKQNKRGL